MSREKWIAALAVGILRLLFGTLRVKIEDRSGFTRKSPDFPVIVTFWHNRILAITTAFLEVYPNHLRKGVSVLTSPSRDGEILSQIMAGFRMGSIRGSSNKRASAAAKECIRRLESGADLAVTPDGPRGPRYVMSPGLILMAQQTGARILPVHAHFSRCLKMKTWDEFRIPLPFSTVHIVASPYETIPPTATEAEFEAQRKRIETILINEAD
ncbi:MAG TPA: lysophospholipid acyltransferase family protein [Chthoniobacterales bacterium]